MINEIDMPANSYRIDYLSAVSGTVGASSVNLALPANSDLIGITSVANAHFRVGTGTQTAIATDPLYVPNEGMLIVKIDSGQNNIAFIQDGASTGTFSVYRVFVS